MRLVIIGAPGAGKGTQATKLCERFKIPHLSTGDIFRSNIKNDTALGKKVKEIINQGKLVPDEITMEIVEDRLKNDDCNSGFLMDGFPRTVRQADFFDRLLDNTGYVIDRAVNLIVSDEVILDRMTGRRVCDSCSSSYHVKNVPSKIVGICDNCGGKLIQREDDKPETVLQRLEVYHGQTKPIIEYYRKKGILSEVKGKHSVDETTNELFRMLGVLNVSY
jgi:adenylate kinase